MNRYEAFGAVRDDDCLNPFPSDTDHGAKEGGDIGGAGAWAKGRAGGRAGGDNM